MRISRHPFDIDWKRQVFEEECQEIPEVLALARHKVNILSSLAIRAERVYETGGALAPDSVEVAQALRLAAQANTALLAFARLQDPPLFLPVGDGPPVTYTAPCDRSLVDPGRWVTAFEQAVVSRQSALVELLCGISSEQLKDSPTWGEQGAYDWADLHRALWQQPTSFTRHPAFSAVADDCRRELEQDTLRRNVKSLVMPYIGVLPYLEKGHEPGFAAALTEALREHQRYWGATEKRRNTNDGLVALSLTAVAALAWDRGMRFDVESDYMPGSWVSGRLFRDGPGSSQGGNPTTSDRRRV